ncbi:MAG TPA: hypothetical protein VNK26_07785 [Pyrinomonadaceae bacterium]|nr:hypothetical protein [Pyrinomonadaceae bacterium]
MHEILPVLPSLIMSLFIAILFIQSGLDKVFDWSGNLSWLNGHFSKTFLSPFVSIMLATITVTELAAGFTAAAGIIYYFIAKSTVVIFFAGVLSALSITALFFGQRVAKDYAGAAVLVPYFILMILLMLLSYPR